MKKTILIIAIAAVLCVAAAPAQAGCTEAECNPALAIPRCCTEEECSTGPTVSDGDMWPIWPQPPLPVKPGKLRQVTAANVPASAAPYFDYPAIFYDYPAATGRFMSE